MFQPPAMDWPTWYSHVSRTVSCELGYTWTFCLLPLFDRYHLNRITGYWSMGARSHVHFSDFFPWFNVEFATFTWLLDSDRSVWSKSNVHDLLSACYGCDWVNYGQGQRSQVSLCEHDHRRPFFCLTIHLTVLCNRRSVCYRMISVSWKYHISYYVNFSVYRVV